MNRRSVLKHVLSAFVDDEEQTIKPTVSTLISEWMRAERDSAGCMKAGQEFLGVNLKVSQTIGDNFELRNVKIRIINKFQYEPFLEENEKRISDIIQIYPKEFVFDPPAELVIKLPSCVGPKSCGQLVCIYSSNRRVRYGAKYLKWRPLDSHCFVVNLSRTEARIICERSGLYTFKITQQPLVIKKLDAHTNCELELKEYEGIQIKFPTGCVAKKMPVTLQTISSDELYSEPTPVAVVSASKTLDSWLPQSDFHLQDLNTRDMVDVTSSPVVLIRPSRYRFLRPVQLTLTLLGNTFEDFFAREETRILVMTSKVPDQETISWKYHYSTPEVKTNESGFKVASFLITKGGLYKLVRRLANSEISFIKQISTSISREIYFNSSSNKRYFVTASLRGFMTEIAEPGKQFVLRIALFGNSQPANPDLCFVSEVCSQPLSLPLGLTRFLVRGSFEPDRDAPDHDEERIVMYTGKTLFVDFCLKLKLKDPTKLPDVIGKVSVHGEEEVQFYISLHKPIPTELDDLVINNRRHQENVAKARVLTKRQSTAVVLPLRKVEDRDEEDISLSSNKSLTHDQSLPLLSSKPLTKGGTLRPTSPRSANLPGITSKPKCKLDCIQSAGSDEGSGEMLWDGILHCT